MTQRPAIRWRALALVRASLALIAASMLAACPDSPSDDGPENEPPDVDIVSPADGAIFNPGETIHLEADVFDEEDGDLPPASLVWVWEGALMTIGTGPSVDTDLGAPGLNTISLTATDSDGADTQRQVQIHINYVPDEVMIISPAHGAVFTTADEILFSGSANDEEDGALDGASLRWTSHIDGIIGTGATTSSTLTAGIHVVTLTAIDSRGMEALVNNIITIEASGCALGNPDSDGDRLPNCAETNTGVYVGTLDTGTNPSNPDTDADGLADGDEVLGTVAGLNLPAFGVSPLRRDILIEYDWFDDANECAPHSHRPTADAVGRVLAAFANAPTPNPDGSNGINVVQDYGQGGVYAGGNLVADANGVIAGGVFGIEFVQYKGANFAANRNGYFHYVLMPHRYDTNSGSSGQASINGDDMIVSLQCVASHAPFVANTVVHELGHNLGLLHGGLDDTNWKPNYNSVMNYRYQFAGVDSDCSPPGNGILDLSRGQRADLNETSLNESLGICGAGFPWDWNGDFDTADVGLQRDINADFSGFGDGFLTVLRDFNDWNNLYFAGIGGAVPGVSPARTVAETSCQNTPMVVVR